MTRALTAPRLLLAALTLSAAVLLPTTGWAFTMTLSIPDVCAGPVTVLAFDTEVGSLLVREGGGGASAGKPSVKPLTVVKSIDQCTPLLFRQAFTGRVARTATLVVAGPHGAPFFTIVLDSVFVTDIKHDSTKARGNPDGNDALMESVTLEAVGTISFTSGAVTVTCNVSTFACQ